MINSFLFDLDDTIISREKAFDGVLKSLIVKWFDSYSPKEKNNLFTVLKDWDQRGLVDRPEYLQKILDNKSEENENLKALASILKNIDILDIKRNSILNISKPTIPKFAFPLNLLDKYSLLPDDKVPLP